MTKQDWAPEPWEYITGHKQHVPFGLRAADGVAIFMLDDKLGPIIPDADGERIAACVSACAGVPTEDLERLPVKQLMKVYPMFDDLLAQSKKILTHFKEATDD